jgi:hypothetical protein
MARRPILLTTLAFAVIGPFIGALLVMLWIMVFDAVTGRHAVSTQPLTLTAWAVLVWSYGLAWLPASAVGLCWGLFSVRLNRSHSLTPVLRAATGACIGGLCGAAGGLLLDWSLSSPLEHTRLVLLCTPCALVGCSFLCTVFPRAPWLQHGPLTIAAGDRDAH